jgi:hypothetical protein
MGLRKFAAYTLLGWYLLIPPSDPGAPLSQWTRAGSFKTAGECKAQRYKNISEASKVRENQTEAVQKARNSKCVPTDALK